MSPYPSRHCNGWDRHTEVQARPPQTCLCCPLPNQAGRGSCCGLVLCPRHLRIHRRIAHEAHGIDKRWRWQQPRTRHRQALRWLDAWYATPPTDADAAWEVAFTAFLRAHRVQM